MRTASSALDTGSFVLERIREHPRRRTEREEIVQTAHEAYLAAGGRSPTGGEWVWNAHRVTWVRKDCVVKVSRSAYGESALRRDLSVRTCIHARPAWASWRPMVAGTLGEYHSPDRFAVVEERLPGPSLLALAHDQKVMALVRGEVAQMRHATAHEVEADDWLYPWFFGPSATVATLLRRWGQRPAAEAVTQWAFDVAMSIQGNVCRVVLVHGDLWPGNILLRPGTVPGIIDWDQASFHDAALHDLLHLTLYPLSQERKEDLGLLLRRLLTDRDDATELRAALRRSGVHEVLCDVGVTERDALLWYWLRHVDRMIREPGHANNPRWVRNNVVALATTLIKERETR